MNPDPNSTVTFSDHLFYTEMTNYSFIFLAVAPATIEVTDRPMFCSAWRCETSEVEATGVFLFSQRCSPVLPHLIYLETKSKAGTVGVEIKKTSVPLLM